MKPGVRALGIAESYPGREAAGSSTVAGAVVRADRVVDGLAFTNWTIGGIDATDAVSALVAGLEREDVRYVLLGALAPAWYNILDLQTVADRIDRPVLAVTFEASEGLEPGLTDAFSGDDLDRRLAVYRRLPPRRELEVGDETVYVRAVGIDDAEADAVVRAFTPEGGRPEPLRVARLAARAGGAFRDRE